MQDEKERDLAVKVLGHQQCYARTCFTGSICLLLKYKMYVLSIIKYMSPMFLPIKHTETVKEFKDFEQNLQLHDKLSQMFLAYHVQFQ